MNSYEQSDLSYSENQCLLIISRKAKVPSLFFPSVVFVKINAALSALTYRTPSYGGTHPRMIRFSNVCRSTLRYYKLPCVLAGSPPSWSTTRNLPSNFYPTVQLDEQPIAIFTVPMSVPEQMIFPPLCVAQAQSLFIRPISLSYLSFHKSPTTPARAATLACRTASK